MGGTGIEPVASSLSRSAGPPALLLSDPLFYGVRAIFSRLPDVVFGRFRKNCVPVERQDTLFRCRSEDQFSVFLALLLSFRIRASIASVTYCERLSP